MIKMNSITDDSMFESQEDWKENKGNESKFGLNLKIIQFLKASKTLSKTEDRIKYIDRNSSGF